MSAAVVGLLLTSLQQVKARAVQDKTLAASAQREAERVARIGLDAAALQGGFPADWSQLTAGSTDWTAAGPARFFLFTMKALAFIELRRHNRVKALAILAKMAEIDPADQVGYGTIAALARGLGDGLDGEGGAG